MSAARLPQRADRVSPGPGDGVRDGVRRMALYADTWPALGRPFGSWPVRDWFWQRVPPAATPTHFVATMGMGFRAANLDHCARFASRLRSRRRPQAPAASSRWAKKNSTCASGLPLVQSATGGDGFELWAEHLPPPIEPVADEGPSLDRAARKRAGLPGCVPRRAGGASRSCRERRRTSNGARERTPHAIIAAHEKRPLRAGRAHDRLRRHRRTARGRPAHLIAAPTIPSPRRRSHRRHVAPTDGASGEVTVCGQRVPREGSWRAEGRASTTATGRCRVGLNWFGLETPDRAPHGLWARPMESSSTRRSRSGSPRCACRSRRRASGPATPPRAGANRGSIDTGHPNSSDPPRALPVAQHARAPRLPHLRRLAPQARSRARQSRAPATTTRSGSPTSRRLAALAEAYQPVLGVDLCNGPTPSAGRSGASSRRPAAGRALPPTRACWCSSRASATPPTTAARASSGARTSPGRRQPVGLPRERLVYSPRLRPERRADALLRRRRLPAQPARHLGRHASATSAAGLQRAHR